MKSKSKKTKSAGRFGARYGKRVRAKLVGVETKQRIKQKCPFCGKMGVKRLSKGLWQCRKCNKKFAHDVYHLPSELILSEELNKTKQKTKNHANV
jgi:large subunit ribosomal protein L37Ae